MTDALRAEVPVACSSLNRLLNSLPDFELDLHDVVRADAVVRSLLASVTSVHAFLLLLPEEETDSSSDSEVASSTAGC
jgi:hypothetical protein